MIYAINLVNIWVLCYFCRKKTWKIIMADNFLERQYAAYEERKAAIKSGKKPASKTKFYTRPGKKQ